MRRVIVYIHGKGGSAAEAEHYKPLFPGVEVLGFDYRAETPWEAKEEFTAFFEKLGSEYGSVELIANSIGAFFAMNADAGRISRAYFISPVVDMEKLITDMLAWAGAVEDELRLRGNILTPFGETLSWEYLCYVRANPVRWAVPTDILYGEKDHLTSFETLSRFAESIGAPIDVMPGGEHWFHTKEQMEYLDRWLCGASGRGEEIIRC